VNCNLALDFHSLKYLSLKLSLATLIVIHKVLIIYPYIYQWDAEVYADVCKMCSAPMIQLLVVVFITKYEKDKYFVPEGHEMGPSAGIDIPIVPGMVFGLKVKGRVWGFFGIAAYRPIVPLPPVSSLHSSPEVPRTT